MIEKIGYNQSLDFLIVQAVQEILPAILPACPEGSVTIWETATRCISERESAKPTLFCVQRNFK